MFLKEILIEETVARVTNVGRDLQTRSFLIYTVIIRLLV